MQRLILRQKKKSGEVLVWATNHRSFSNGGNNDYGDSISDLVRKVKGKCENGKMYKYSKGVGSGANYN